MTWLMALHQSDSRNSMQMVCGLYRNHKGRRRRNCTVKYHLKYLLLQKKKGVNRVFLETRLFSLKRVKGVTSRLQV